MDKSRFSATDSTVGYLYQVRLALAHSLRRVRTSCAFAVSIETLDDVAFETRGAPADLLQLKHHRNREANLTDASPDLWKTLRVWFDGTKSGAIPSGSNLHLLTTGQAPPDSAPGQLRTNGRNVEAALSALTTTAQTSSNKTNEAAYALYTSFSESERRRILESVYVIDGAPSVTDLDADLRELTFFAVERRHQDAFLERLEGWWFRRTIIQLTDPTRSDRILGSELEAEFSDLREQFKADALPIDEDLLLLDLDDALTAAHKNAVFVEQLRLTKARASRIASAVRDYYRAFEQRSRWIRRDLLHVGDLSKYERRLAEEWQLAFDAVIDELGPDAADEQKEKAARQLLQWAESASIPIRPAVTEPFVTRGSLHMLSDSQAVGWHPDFRSRLAAILSKKTAT